MKILDRLLCLTLGLLLLSGAHAALAAEPSAAEKKSAGSPPSVTAAPPAVSSESGPAAARAVVESLHAVLLRCMKEGSRLGFEGRLEQISQILDKTFDLPLMARVSVGKAWKQIDPARRAEFVGLSRRLSASKYAKNFSDYGGQHFATIVDEPAARGTILVKTEFVQPEDDDVRFDYRLRKVGSDWRIIDIQLDGKISEITLRRADYRSVIQRQGYEALVELITKQIADLEAES